MSEEDAVRLRHMLDEARRTQKFIANRQFEDMNDDDMLAYSVVRAEEIIGEAASRISDELRAQTPEIPWRQMIGMRNIIVHAYADISYRIVWEVATINLPELILMLEKLLESDEN
jgi:uncharacterized protein with HEPN domain